MNMFVGVDHGTRAIRFASELKAFELRRDRAIKLSPREIIELIEKNLEIHASDIELLGMSYSMGDAISKITPIKEVEGRGVKEGNGSGTRIGGGTKVFDAIRTSSIPAILIPGIHRGNVGDPRMNIFSHGASPEKLGVCYHIYLKGYESFIVSDVSSNTVTVGVAAGKIVGALDACLFAPGALQGPLDLEMIREVDSGSCSANDAFSKGGIIHKIKNLDGVTPKSALALFVSMEIAAMAVILKDYGFEFKDLNIFLTGTIGCDETFRANIENLLACDLVMVDKWTAARGCCEIAKAVFEGKREILGVGVESTRSLMILD
jgi:putative methanogenesis marker protein 12